MNFDKFKKIDMPDVQVNPDLDYAKKLNDLPKTAQKGRALATLGTIAAAVVIVLAVSLWALIGRGIRGTADDPILQVPADESVEITEQMQQDFETMFGKYSLHSFPTFERGTLPSKEALLAFLDHEQATFLADFKLRNRP